MLFEFPHFLRPPDCWRRFVRCGLAILFGCTLLLGSGRLSSVAAQGKQVSVHPDSQFWIQGEATTHDFTCQVQTVQGEATLPPVKEALSSKTRSSEDEQTSVRVRVPVRAFDCGRRRMTEDLQETLKMEEHPQIRFELVHASVGAPTDTSGRWREIRVLGTLTIAGKKRLINLEAKGHAIDENRFRVRGCRPIRMTDFNIDPPTKAFGLIKVKDRVEVQFDLFAHAQTIDSTASFKRVSVDGRPTCSGGD